MRQHLLGLDEPLPDADNGIPGILLQCQNLRRYSLDIPHCRDGLLQARRAVYPLHQSGWINFLSHDPGSFHRSSCM